MARKKKEEIIEDAKIEENVSEIKQDSNVPEFYTLRIGETLKDVATKFGLNETQLKELNGEVIGTNQVRLK